MLNEDKREDERITQGKKAGSGMDYMKYITIQVIKKSERSEVVFAAVDELDMPVVVKRLKGGNPEIYREITKLRNIHIPRIYCVEEKDEELCIAEEYIDGRTLDVYMAEETLTDEQKLELGLQLCEALEALHQCKPPVIHRDIKPSNILITGDGILKIIDFDASRQYKSEKNTSDTRLLGTVEYAAPEQFGYAQTDARSDIYSVGVVFSEIKIESVAPFIKDWKRLVDKCTSFDPENRYRDVTELKKDLLKCIAKAKQPFWKRVVVPAVGGAALLAVLVATGIKMYQKGEQAAISDVPTSPTVQVTKEEKQQPEEIKPAGEPTEAVRPLDAPTSTPQPKMIIKPEEVTGWEVPALRPGHIGEDGSVIPAKRLVGERTEKVGYTCFDMEYEDSHNASYSFNDNAAMWVKYDKIYASVSLELPEVFDMKYCNRLVVRAKNEAGDIVVILYDENHEEVEHLYLDKTEGAQEFFFYPKTKAEVEYIGFMANDGELMDYSEFESIIYYVDFYMLNPDSPSISYQMADLKEENYYFLTRTYNKDGAVKINFNRLYGQLMLELPEPVDMKYCKGVGLVLESEDADLSVTFYDEEFNAIDAYYDIKTDGVEEVMLDYLTKSKVYGIGLMTDDQDLSDYTDCDATVYTVNFYMENGYEKD